MRRLLDPLAARSTWRRWGYLLLGGALLMPYMMAGQVVAGLARGSAGEPLSIADPGVFLAVLPVVLLTALVLPVRGLEVATVRELLVPALTPGPGGSWAERWRTAGWFTLHAAVGGVVSGLSLALPPFAGWLVSLVLVGDRAGLLGPGAPGPGWDAWWAVPAAFAVLLGLVYLVAAAGALLARVAPALLGPRPADRLAALQRRADDLAERNRLARELHDSVGHALSVVTLQAGAGARVIDDDPTFAREALEAIADSARDALEDLDHVLGLLREERSGSTAPQPTLADLDDLLTRTGAAGLDVRADVDPAVARVPAAVSREAYRIVQEGLTNTLRHAGRVPVVLRLRTRRDVLLLDLDNPLRGGPRDTAPDPGGGRGLVGIRERVEVLGGDVQAGPADGRWHLSVRLPL